MAAVARLALCAVLGSLVVGTTPAAPEMTMVQVGGARYALDVRGQGQPTIVFEAGQGEDHRSWETVAARLAPCARVVMYDRLGLGRSGPLHAPGLVLADDVAARLAALLRALDAPPPYLLVGHSLGGLYVQAFARRFPKEVAAVVLVDSTSPFEPRGVFASTQPPPPGSTAAAEDAGVAPSVEAMLAGPPFPPVPLIVLAATAHGMPPQVEAVWQEVQARTATLSPRGRLDVVEGSGHFIQSERPEQVVSAVLRAARESGFDLSACQVAR